MKICFFHHQCMSKASRLCYHAVPRIVKTDVTWVNEPLYKNDEGNAIEVEPIDDVENDEDSKYRKKRRLTLPCDNDYNDAFVEELWCSIVDSEQWKPFADYISDCRINMNVRQVLELGEQSLNSK